MHSLLRATTSGPPTATWQPDADLTPRSATTIVEEFDSGPGYTYLSNDAEIGVYRISGTPATPRWLAARFR